MNKNTLNQLFLKTGDFLKRNAVYLIGFCIIFIAVWRLRGTYDFAVLPNRGAKLAVYLYFFIGFAAVCFTMAKTKKLHLIFLVAAVVLGIGFMLALPLQLIPDEMTHYMRAYEIADGNFIAAADATGGVVREFPGNLFIGGSNYQEYFAQSGSRLDYINTTENPYTSAALYSPLSYLPQALGIFIARLFTDNAMAVFYTARIFNFAFGTALVYFAIKLIPFGKFTVFTIALMPMFLHQQISLSADVITNSLALFSVALALKISHEECKHPKRYLALLSVCLIVMTMCKIVYLLFILLIFTVPSGLFQSKRNAWIFKFSILLAALAANMLWMAVSSRYFVEFRAGVNITEQIKFVLSNPITYLWLLLKTFIASFPTFFSAMIGFMLGPLTIAVSPWGYLTYMFLFIIAVCITCDNQRIKKSFKLVQALIFAGTAVLICSALYAQWTPVGVPYIEGIQGRYFIPIILPFALFLPQLLPLKNTEDSGSAELSLPAIETTGKHKMLVILMLFANFIALSDIICYFC